MAQEKEPQLK
jgi:hypothetical protein